VQRLSERVQIVRAVRGSETKALASIASKSEPNPGTTSLGGACRGPRQAGQQLVQDGAQRITLARAVPGRRRVLPAPCTLCRAARWAACSRGAGDW
jgi:hypothetical protein